MEEKTFREKRRERHLAWKRERLVWRDAGWTYAEDAELKTLLGIRDRPMSEREMRRCHDLIRKAERCGVKW